MSGSDGVGPNFDVVAMRPFVPAKDFEISKAFYADLVDPSGVLWHIAQPRR